MRPTILLLALAATSLTTVGCDGDDPEDDLDVNTFTLRVGDGETETRRTAVFGVTEQEGDEVFGLFLGASGLEASADGSVLAFAGAETELPDEGEYDLYDFAEDLEAGNPPDGEVLAIYFDLDDEEDPRFYVSGSGTLEVTGYDEEDEELVGRYNARVRRIDIETGEAASGTVRLEGAFRARRDDAVFEGEAPPLQALRRRAAQD